MRSLHHVGYWVDDLDAALKRWGDDLGVGPFQVIGHMTFEEFVLVVDGQEHRDVVFDHSSAFAAWGPVVVELSQVHAIDDRRRAIGPDLGRLARRRADVPAPDRGAPAQQRHRRDARPPGRAARRRGPLRPS